MENKTVLITGGSSGIGSVIVDRFLDSGYFVISVSRGASKARSGHHIHIQTDLSEWDNCIGLYSEVAKKISKLDVLVNNVGRSGWKALGNVSRSFFEEMFNLNVGSYFAVTQSMLPLLVSGSVVINVSSMAGKRGSANNSVYSASKFAINGFTQSLSKELGPKGIRVNALCPVLIRSQGLDMALVEEDAPAFNKGISKFLDEFKSTQSALNRLPEAIDVANAALWLASKNMNAVTGQCINIDCGVFPQ
jgi:NAD(P)-dependent dehydrogenase (short-subunit alcohol dehydrogenase family)